MLRQALQRPFFRFLFLSISLYLAWYFIYELYLKERTRFDEMVINNLVVVAEWVLVLFGYALTPYNDGFYRNHIGISGTNGVTVGAPCDGIVLFALFVVFVVSYPGPWKHRAWFIPSGLVVIHLLNALRVAALAMIVHWNEAWLSFNHDYTFTILVYSIVFGLWWIWISRFSSTRAGAAS